MRKQFTFALVVLALAALSCQYLSPETTPIPPMTPTGGPAVGVTAAVPPPATASAGGTTPSQPSPGATTNPATSGLLRDPVADADRATAQALSQAQVPVRDLRDLAIRLKGVPADTPPVACATSPDYAVGTHHTFNAQDQSTNQQFQVDAILRYKNDVVYMWVAASLRGNDAGIKQAADTFAQKIYPTDRNLLGSETSPGIDCDKHISILTTPGLGGAAGYVSGADTVTKAVRPDSNEMDLIYMNSQAFNNIGDQEYLGVLAHEFQHVISENVHKNLDTWMNEGFSDLAIYLNGYDVSGHPLAFLANPGTQLNAWAELEQSIPHYGESFMYLTYFYSRFGPDATRALLADPNHGLEAMDNTLKKFSPGMTVGDFFNDWQAALYLNDPNVGQGQFSYKDLTFPKPRVDRTINTFPYTQNGSVNHWGSQYLVLRGPQDVTVNFTGATQVRLMNMQPRGQLVWYSGRGDNSDFSLTREFDLSGAQSATLKYWTWFDVEQDWDYYYVEASTDGKAWKILKTPSGTDTNPSGNSYGWAYTGKSGGKDVSQWIEESVSLSEFAGKKVQVRFEYVTDDALNFSGVALQDISIPEINYAYNASSGDGGWQAKGFIRTNNLEPETYTAQLITFGNDGTTQVQRLAMKDDQTGQWSVPLSKLKNAVLVLSAQARTTTEPAPYRLEIK